MDTFPGQEILTEWACGAGPPGLFVASLLAATLLPFSSELALAGGIEAGIPVIPALVACSLGNSLACLINYALGWAGRARTEAKLSTSRTGRAALRWMDRFGVVSLLASWLPVIGDPLTIVAGVFRVPLRWFVPIVVSLRVLRYVALAFAMV